MNRWRMGEDMGSKEMVRCPLTFNPDRKGQAEDYEFNDLYDDDIYGDAILGVGHTTCDNMSDIIPDIGQQAACNNLGDIVLDVGQHAT
jgi:hypothetical protein